MKLLLWLLLGAVHLHADEDVTGATPVQKVLELLSAMKKKGEEEKQKEALQYAAYEQFCKSTQEEKAKGIEDGADKIDSLKADLAKLSIDIKTLTGSIPEVVEEIEKATGDLEKATKARAEERAAYTKAHSETLQAVKSVGKARKALKEKEVTPEQAESFLQLAKESDLTDDDIAAFTGSQARTAIESFISEATNVEKPEAYTFQSGKVIELLDDLEEKFRKEREAMEKSETEKKHAYELLTRDWKAQIATGKKAQEDKLAAKLRKDQVKAEKSAALVEVTKLNEGDKKYLEDLKQTCSQKASDFKERQKLRGEELAAIDKAAEAIQGTVLKVTEKRSAKGTSLAALRSDSGGAKREQAISLLKERAEELDSNMLSALALRVEGDPLSKIRKMISELVTRLQKEAAADAEKDGWCKKEMATNKQTRSSKKDLVDNVQGEVNQLKIDLTELADDLETLTKDIASLTKDRESATKLRANEKAENKATIKDAQDAQKAIAQATAALDSFYSGTKAKASFLQQQVDGAPEIFEDSSYSGMDNGGVTALLEVLQADFVRMESETETSEAQSLGEYTKFMSDSAVDKAAKEKEVELKTATKTEKTNALTTKKIDLKDAKKALTAATEYFEELKAQCMKPVLTREEKMAQRKQEIESLKDVLEVLQGTS